MWSRSRRGDQYVRAIRRFYKKTGHYPGSLEQLENTNHIRFLRQRYVDPLTGKSDWRLIGVGKNQTTVKGFFGEPLTGLQTGGLGAAAGLQAGIGGSSTPGASPAQTPGQTAGQTGPAAGVPGGTGAPGAAGAAGSSDPNGFGGSSGIGAQSASTFGGSGSGPFMGVGTSATGTSIAQPNQQTTYETWEFLYDPRIELLKQKAALEGGIGTAPGSSSSPFGGGSQTSQTPTSQTANPRQ